MSQPLSRKPHPEGLRQARWMFGELMRADLEKNAQISSRTTLAIWRANQVLKDQPGPVAFVLRRVARFADVLWIRGFMGAELPPMVWAGPGLRIPHAGRGVILHPNSTIGADATIYHHVTLGIKDGTARAPQLDDNVFIGAGARVIGDVHLADGTAIGANAVVLKSTEANKTYAGVPAREVVSTRGDKAP